MSLCLFFISLHAMVLIGLPAMGEGDTLAAETVMAIVAEAPPPVPTETEVSDPPALEPRPPASPAPEEPAVVSPVSEPVPPPPPESPSPEPPPTIAPPREHQPSDDAHRTIERHPERARKPTVEKPRAESRTPRRVSISPAPPSMTDKAREARDAAARARAGFEAAYGARVKAIFLARISGMGLREVSGTVGLSFTIGAGGDVRSVTVTRSCGDAATDARIRAVAASSSFPPPPSGSFSASVTVRIH